jgi:hypothetical protein
MGCGTIHNTPNSTIRLSQNLIYITNTSENTNKRGKQDKTELNKS